eukprot:scaffold11342_cov114-Isochrysis_galbana.AAC.9
MQSLPSILPVAANGMQSQKPTLSTDASWLLSAARTLPAKDPGRGGATRKRLSGKGRFLAACAGGWRSSRAGPGLRRTSLGVCHLHCASLDAEEVDRLAWVGGKARDGVWLLRRRRVQAMVHRAGPRVPHAHGAILGRSDDIAPSVCEAAVRDRAGMNGEDLHHGALRHLPHPRRCVLRPRQQHRAPAVPGHPVDSLGRALQRDDRLARVCRPHPHDAVEAARREVVPVGAKPDRTNRLAVALQPCHRLREADAPQVAHVVTAARRKEIWVCSIHRHGEDGRGMSCKLLGAHVLDGAV